MIHDMLKRIKQTPWLGIKLALYDEMGHFVVSWFEVVWREKKTQNISIFGD